jgi:glutamate racemase
MIIEKSVGVLDSGVGGISILRALVEFMPYENFMYFGDSANAPYGEKTREEIAGLTVRNVATLLEKGCKAIVVACNTATAAAIVSLREKYPDVPMIGLEPALKPAVLYKENSRIIVMATPFTLESQKFNELKSRYQDQAEIISLPCPEIVNFVERQEMYSPQLLHYLRQKFKPYQRQKIDAIVLGCTHFPFVRRAIQEVAGRDVILYDSALGVGRQVRRQLDAHDMLNTSEKRGQVEIFNSKGPEGVELCEKLLYQM